MSATTPKVTVCVVTYDHERYVAQALESVLMQKVSFPVEIFVSDDASKDKTQEIVATYARRYPDRLRLALRKQNLGPARHSMEIVESARGEYMAVLEGDDYWLSPDKLATQVAFLDANPSFSMCCHNVLVVGEGLEPEVKRTTLSGDAEGGVIRFEELLSGYDISTGSSVFRRSSLPPTLPNWWFEFCLRTSGSGDWTMAAIAAESGPIRFLPEVMSAYRVHPKGLWSKKTTTQRAESHVRVQETFNEVYGTRYARHIRPGLAIRKMDLAGLYAAEGRTVDAARTALNGVADIAASPGARERLRLVKLALVALARPIDPASSPPLPRLYKAVLEGIMDMNRRARQLVS